MTLQRFRKEPVEVEAVRFGGSSSQAAAIQQWIETGRYVHPVLQTRDFCSFTISTLEGDLTVQPGDWVVRGVMGEFHPVRADIFAATYTPSPDQ
jgi:hypothetical protein